MKELCCACSTVNESHFEICVNCGKTKCWWCTFASAVEEKKPSLGKAPLNPTVTIQKKLPVVVEEEEIPTVVEEKQNNIRAEPKLDRDVPRRTKFIEHVDPIDVRSVPRCEGNSSWESRRGHLKRPQNHVRNAALGEEESAGCKCVVL